MVSHEKCKPYGPIRRSWDNGVTLIIFHSTRQAALRARAGFFVEAGLAATDTVCVRPPIPWLSPGHHDKEREAS